MRLTFKAFHEVLRQQGDSIKALERTLDGKAGRTEVAAALQQKANASEMAARLAEVGCQRAVGRLGQSLGVCMRPAFWCHCLKRGAQRVGESSGERYRGGAAAKGKRKRDGGQAGRGRRVP